MFNSHAKYKEDLREAMAEDPQGTMQFIQKERDTACNSYPVGKKVKYCSICKEPMAYGSVSYDEGIHIDNCI